MKDAPVFSILPLVPILLIDASLTGVQVALLDAAPKPPRPAAAGVRGSRRLLWHEAHTENMGALTAISRLTNSGLRATGLTMLDIVGLAVATGPGSFTGIKIGMAFVAGLRAGRDPDLPVLALSTLDAAAAALSDLGRPSAVFLPATRTHGFVALAPGPANRTAATAATLVDCEQTGPAFLASLPAHCSVTIAGDWALMTAAAAAAGCEVQHVSVAELGQLALGTMAEQAAASWPSGFAQALPEPRYQRLSTAEERLLVSAAPAREETRS